VTAPGLRASVERRLVELGADHDLAPGVLDRLRAILALFATDPEAPTAVRDPLAAVDVHVADALSALALPGVQRARRGADLGSGAGVPGLVLAAARPGLAMALVESVGRKGEFLRRAVAAVGCRGVDVVVERAEDWDAGLGAHDLICARALASLPVVAEYAAPLLTEGGELVAWRGRRDAADEQAGARAALELGMELVEVRRVAPFNGAADHHLHVLRKVAPTPERFPRRAGMARKRPLGTGNGVRPPARAGSRPAMG